MLRQIKGTPVIVVSAKVDVDDKVDLLLGGAAEVKLARTEYAILKLLMQNPAQVVTKSLLLERISEDTPRLHGKFTENTYQRSMKVTGFVSVLFFVRKCLI